MTKIKYPVTILLIVINTAVFLLTDLTGSGSQDAARMLRFGAAYTPLILEGEYYRLFTACFLHFGIQHLFSNMLSLAVLGSRMESLLKSVRFLMIYLLGGLAGNLVSLAMDLRGSEADMAVSAGASGCVFALIGGMICAVIKNRGRFSDLTGRQVLILAAVSLYMGFASEGVDNAAHLGGLIAGFLLTALLFHPQKEREGASGEAGQ